MDYNTKRNKLVLREYGRNVQKLIEHATTIENDEERNTFAQSVIDLMGHLNPHLRNIDDFKHKLWHHLILISDFKLKVDSPYDMPPKETFFEKPDHIGYPEHNIKFRHYGKNIEVLIQKAIALENEPEKQKEFIESIGSYMKMVSNNWNKDFVNDDIIKGDLKTLSGGKLEVPDDINLDLLAKATRKKKPDNNRRNDRGGGGHHRGGGRGHHGKGGYQKRRSY